MDRPTAATVRAASATNAGEGFDWTRFGFEPPAAPDDPDALDGIVARAVAYVEQTTARTLDASLPPELEPLAIDAVMMRTAQIIVSRTGTKAIRTAIGNVDVQSLRAGDFSVTRFNPNLNRGGLRALQVNPWLELSEVLLLLATPEKRAQLLAELTGISPPVALAVETYNYGDGPYTADPDF